MRLGSIFEENPTEKLYDSTDNQKLILENDDFIVPGLDMYAEDDKVVVSKKRTYEAASAYKGTKTAVHNFVSDSNLGGEVVRGASAQEECLCRCYGLYFNLNTRPMWNGFYDQHRVTQDSIHNDDFPEFIQLRVDEDKYSDIVEQMKKDINLEKGSPAPFVVKLLLINYLLFLESNGVEIIKQKKEDSGISKRKLLEEFKKLSPEDKMDAIYELLLEIKTSR